MDNDVLLPFHKSFIRSIKRLDENLKDLLGVNNVFIVRFRIEVIPLLALAKITIIPHEHLAQTIDDLKTFYQGFELRYDRTKPELGNKEERDAIDLIFFTTIKNLSDRLSQDKEVMNKATSLEEALKLGLEYLPPNSRFVGPKGKITLLRNGVPKGRLAEISVMDAKSDSKNVLFTAYYKENDVYDLASFHKNRIEDWTDKW